MQWNIKKFNVNKIKDRFSNPVILCLVTAICLNLFVEVMSRQSLFGAFHYLFTNPLIFLYNTTLIAVTLSISLFFKRRSFVMFVISLAWFIIGVTDFVLLMFRTTPFTATDIKLAKSAVAIWKYYLKFYHLILIGVGIAFLVLCCVIVWKKTSPSRTRYSLIKSISFFAITLGLSFLFTGLGLKMSFLATNFGNLANAFHDYGLPYCFVNSVINTGIDKPTSYNEAIVSEIVNAIEKGDVVDPSLLTPSGNKDITPTTTPMPTPSATPTPEPTKIVTKEKPNIIMLQLESFFDPTLIKGINYTTDPLPTFHKLQKKYTSGFLNVPSIGAGTANTEFEAITGMNLDFFGPGEYPYKTILQKTTAESVSYNLKGIGYTTHAIHNNTGTFYDRNQVFAQLGFDTFTPIEYMLNIERTPTNWAKDFVLTSQIKETLESTPNQDFIYTISVQGHGSYPTENILEEQLFDITMPEGLESLYYPLLYYSHQIHEMDQFIAELIDYLNSIDEDTVLVMYGDHLPGFQLTAENLENGDLFQTPYVMWSNFDMDIENRTIEAYQLYSYVLGRLDINNGLITKFHQTQYNSEAYLEELKLLEYDMLYGELNCFNGVNPYTKTDLQMGIHKITITNVTPLYQGSDSNRSGLLIEGEYFTPYSKVYVNNEYKTTYYKDSNTLYVPDTPLKDGDIITVVQSCDDMVPLSSTDPYTYTK